MVAPDNDIDISSFELKSHKIDKAELFHGLGNLKSIRFIKIEKALKNPMLG